MFLCCFGACVFFSLLVNLFYFLVLKIYHSQNNCKKVSCAILKYNFLHIGQHMLITLWLFKLGWCLKSYSFARDICLGNEKSFLVICNIKRAIMKHYWWPLWLSRTKKEILYAIHILNINLWLFISSHDQKTWVSSMCDAVVCRGSRQAKDSLEVEW